jgi:sulfonate transport system substrate-binding protein
MLVMRRDSSVRDWESLLAAARADGPPLRIGYKAPVAVAKLVFQGALEAEGIPWGYDASEGNRVVLVNFGSEKSPLPMLERGAIDGFVMNQPGVAVAVHKGLGRVVCELRDLPPSGRWVDHPCCCIAASQETIRQHGPALKAFLKVILLSTDWIHRDEEAAIRCASQWTKYDIAVERMSVPTVRYVAEPTETWLTGMRTWWRMAQEIDLFNGRYADATCEEFMADLCALDLSREAARELRSAGLLGAR